MDLDDNRVYAMVVGIIVAFALFVEEVLYLIGLIERADVLIFFGACLLLLAGCWVFQHRSL